MKRVCLVLFCLALHPLQLSATVLTFEPATNFAYLPLTYGDRVGSATQGGFNYGAGGGFTPNVRIAYSATPRSWTTDYGDLSGVMYSSFGSNMLITLTADPGYLVQLSGLDLAGWPGSDRTLPGLEIRDGTQDLLFSQSNVLVQGDANGPRHTSFVFNSPYTASTLSLYFNLGNNAFGEDIGIDNIAFAQVPEPSSALLLSVAVIGLYRLRRREK